MPEYEYAVEWKLDDDAWIVDERHTYRSIQGATDHGLLAHGSFPRRIVRRTLWVPVDAEEAARG